MPQCITTGCDKDTKSQKHDRCYNCRKYIERWEKRPVADVLTRRNQINTWDARLIIRLGKNVTSIRRKARR